MKKLLLILLIPIVVVIAVEYGLYFPTVDRSVHYMFTAIIAGIILTRILIELDDMRNKKETQDHSIY